MSTNPQIEKLLPCVRYLIAKKYRYISKASTGNIASRFKLSPGEMQAAIIAADRLRRQQLIEGRPGFRVDPLTDIAAPINLGPASVWGGGRLSL